jgi:hypothetical protein
VVISGVCGALAAALIIGLVWLSGWPEMPPPPTPSPEPQANAAGIDALTARVAAIEAKTAKTAERPASAPDPALAARVDALEKSYAALRVELDGLRARSERLAADVNDVKSAPPENSQAPDLSAINERLAQIEGANRAQTADIAQDSAKRTDDAPLRRLVAAALLDVLVRTGDPYPAALQAAKALAPNPDDLKPLEEFAASGVPNAANLSRELLQLVPKLQPPTPENSTTGAGILGRLGAGAAKLVRIERTDAVGNDRGNVIARVTAAALRNDYVSARRELNTLAPAERAAAQSWIDKANARDAALAASRQFAAEAMTALAKPRQ